MPPRIAHCILEPRYSGAEMLVLGLARAQIADGCSVAVIALRPSDPTFLGEMQALGRLRCELFVPARALVGQQRLSWIRRSCALFAPDVLFAHSLLPSLYSRLALVGNSKVSLATVLHADDDFDDVLVRALERLLWRKHSVVVGVSPASLRNYRARITAKQNTRLIANGVELEAVRAAAAQRAWARQHIFNAAPDDIVLLQVGRISVQKQQRLSAAAVGLLRRHISLKNIKLFFAGPIEGEKYYRDIVTTAHALGIAGNIYFLGPCKDVPVLLAGADAHLMPSRWEAQGIAALEALASGVFCVFTALEAFLPHQGLPGVELLPEDATDTQLADVLATAIHTSALTRRYTREMENYGFERCAREYRDLANTLANSHRIR